MRIKKLLKLVDRDTQVWIDEKYTRIVSNIDERNTRIPNEEGLDLTPYLAKIGLLCNCSNNQFRIEDRTETLFIGRAYNVPIPLANRKVIEILPEAIAYEKEQEMKRVLERIDKKLKIYIYPDE